MKKLALALLLCMSSCKLLLKKLVVVCILFMLYQKSFCMDVSGMECITLSKKHRDRVKSLIQEDENVDQEDSTGRTPLIESVQYLCPASIALLLAARANCNIVTRISNGNALHFLFEQLRKRNVALDAQDIDDRALEIIELLRIAGIKLDYVSTNGTVFHMAASLDNTNYICALMLPIANKAIKETTYKKVESLLCALKRREQSLAQLPTLPREVLFHILSFCLSSIECKYSGLDKIIVSPEQRTIFRRHLMREAFPQLRSLISPEESLQLQKTLSLELNAMGLACKAMDIAIDSQNRKILNPETWKVPITTREPRPRLEMLDIEESSLD